MADRDATVRVAARLLGQGAAEQWGRIVAGLLLVFAASGVALLEPWPLKLVVDSVLGDHPLPWVVAEAAGIAPWSSSLSAHGKLSLLLALCLSVVVLQVVVGVLNMLGTNVLVSVGLRMVFKLRCRLFDQMQRLSLAFHDATTVGDSLYRVTWDTCAVQTLFNAGLVPAVTALLTLLGITIVMLSTEWMVAVAGLSLSVPLALLVRRLDRPMTEHSLRVHERESDVSTRVQETLTGIRAVQAFGREEFEGARFRRQAEASLRANLRLTALQTGSQAVVGALMATGTGMVIWIAAHGALRGRITAGDVVLLLGYLVMLYKPLETLAYTAATFQNAAAGARRVLPLLDTMPEIADADGAIDLRGRAQGEVALEDVVFGYREGQRVLHGVSLKIRPGETIALVGASGAGKTTLASLLLRFYDPTAGRITLDGHDLRMLTLRSLRRNVALVLQEPVLFGTTIRENIAYGRPEATDDEIEAAARAAGAHEFIVALPGGYDTQIAERGVSLSGGQRQRLSIARAFLKNAPVLVLDEPTSALDAETEKLLLETLGRLVKGRTTLIIAHRLSTVRGADRIVALQDGAVAEVGTHAELLARGQLYARLCALQFGVPAGACSGGAQ